MVITATSILLKFHLRETMYGISKQLIMNLRCYKTRRLKFRPVKSAAASFWLFEFLTYRKSVFAPSWQFIYLNLTMEASQQCIKSV